MPRAPASESGAIGDRVTPTGRPVARSSPARAQAASANRAVRRQDSRSPGNDLRGRWSSLARWRRVLAASFDAARRRRRPAISDRDFWSLIDTFSEPNGYFNSDNLVSNEDTFQHVIPELVQAGCGRGCVRWRWAGSELHLHRGTAAERWPSFLTFGAAICTVHLMYKALFELSVTGQTSCRRLFSRPRPRVSGR